MINGMVTARDDRHRRIAILASFAPSLINFRGPLLTELVSRGYEVHALAPGIAAVRQQLEAMGVRAVDIQLVNSSLSPFASMRTIRQLARVLREISPEVLLAYTIKPIVLGGRAARAAGVRRFVALVTGVGYAFTPGKELKRLLSRAAALLLYRRAFQTAALAVFQNDDDRELFRKMRLLPRDLPTAIVNGSGVDIDHFAATPVPSGVSFLMIARLLRDKGVREYGEATRLLKIRYPDVRVSLVGDFFPTSDCVTEAELEQVIAAGVEWLGPADDVRPALAASGVYVLPSYREGTPRSVLEALSVGRPVITTDAPGCRETVVDGVNGFLVPPRDSQSLYRAMLRFVEDPGLIPKMSESSRAIAEAKYDVRKINERLLGVMGL